VPTSTIPIFLQAGCPSCRPINSVKALKATFKWLVILCLSFAIAFGALTLLVWHQDKHPACKNLSDEVLAWLPVV